MTDGNELAEAFVRASAEAVQEELDAEERVRLLCFVIMPFAPPIGGYYETVFAPAIRDAGLDARRVDDLFASGAITKDIWRLTQASSVLLAELSEIRPDASPNANVMYELGLAHASRKPTVMVTQSIESIPFDLRGLRVIEYDRDDPEWGAKLRRAIAQALTETLESPLEAVLPTFLEVDETRSAPDVSAIDKAMLEMRSELDVVRREVATMRAAGATQRAVALSDIPSEPLSWAERSDLSQQYASSLGYCVVPNFKNTFFNDPDALKTWHDIAGFTGTLTDDSNGKRIKRQSIPRGSLVPCSADMVVGE